MIVWGTLVTARTGTSRTAFDASTPWLVNGLGVALGLSVFMADSLRVLPQGLDATRTVVPDAFNWPMFVVALALMTAPVVHLLARRFAHTKSPATVQPIGALQHD
jgi:hypothetical protein